MIFEQAFMALPEFLTGTPFQRYQFEGTVVTAFSMAVLQELNSRNVPNPVLLLRAEVAYPVDLSRRADLHINLTGLNLMSIALQGYGYYANNWLEAKFCRLSANGTPVATPLHSTFLLLKDLIRLCSLVPDSMIAGETSESGRYLLHAYQRDPDTYLIYKRNQHGKRVEREWLRKLLLAGRQKISICDLDKESTSTFNSCVGKKGKSNQTRSDAFQFGAPGVAYFGRCVLYRPEPNRRFQDHGGAKVVQEGKRNNGRKHERIRTVDAKAHQSHSVDVM